MNQLTVIQDVFDQTNVKLRIEQSKLQINALETMLKEVLREGVDFGTEKGIDRPFLHLPGAEILGFTFQLRAEFELEDKTIDFSKDPIFVSYDYKCKLYHRDTGVFLGEGVGAANSYEKKFRYQKGTEVKDPLDKQNTIKKFAKKRAYVDAMLTVTGARRLFIPDDDDNDDDAPTSPKQKSAHAQSDPSEMKMPFGNQKDKPLKDISTPDLQWALSRAKSHELRNAITAVIEARTAAEVKTKSEPEKKNGDKNQTSPVTPGSIEEKTIKQIKEYLNSSDTKTKEESAKVARLFLKERKFGGWDDLPKLSEYQGQELLRMIKEAISMG